MGSYPKVVRGTGVFMVKISHVKRKGMAKNSSENMKKIYWSSNRDILWKVDWDICPSKSYVIWWKSRKYFIKANSIHSIEEWIPNKILVKKESK